jgi:vacuolar-type H+-ATPase subunit F/Vma7
MMITVSADVEVEQVFDELSEEDLASYGLVRVKEADWQKVASAIRKNDITEALRIVSEIAYDQVNIVLPPLLTPTTAGSAG